MPASSTRSPRACASSSASAERTRAADTLVLPYNDREAVTEAFANNPNDPGDHLVGSQVAELEPERLEHGHVNEHVDFWSLGHGTPQ